MTNTLTSLSSAREWHRTRYGRWAAALLTLLMLAWSAYARADCGYTFQRPGTVTFTPPATIMLPGNLAYGTVLWTSSPVTPTNPMTLTCTGTTQSGIENSQGSQPQGDDTLFPTNVSGLSYRLLHTDTFRALRAYPDEPVPPGSYQFSVPTALQLVVTGAINPNDRLKAGQLAQWYVDMQFCYGQCYPLGSAPVETFSTTSIRFAASTCSTPGVTVVLPTVFTSNFSAVGSVAGRTPFNVQFSCSVNTKPPQIVLSTGDLQPGTTSVIEPAIGAGYAQNVGVQILDSKGNQITFNAPMSAGTSSNGVFNVPFYAQYYQTGTPVTAGQVHAIATYTLTYQ